MKTKKILAAIAALTLVFGAVPTQPFADVIGNMAITASAETSEDDFSFSDGVIWGYYGSDTEVVIPSTIDGVTVTSIGECAFIGRSVTSITIPDSVTSIGDNAFQGCESLSTIKMNSVTSIGLGAFSGCSSLDTIKMNSVTSIGLDAFSGCSSLDTIKMNSVTSIGESAFSGCDSLASVTLGSEVPDGLDEIPASAEIIVPCTLNGNAALAGRNITYNHIFAEDSDACECDEKVERYITGSCGAYHEEPDTYDEVSYKFDKLTGTLTISGTGAVKESAFDAEWADDKEKEFASDIKTVVSGNGITKIENFAFYGCLSLTTVEMNSVTLIEYGAFCNCSSLETVEMNSVTSIGVYAFQKCTSLASVEMNSVTSIGEYAFQWCESLETVEMNSVTSIGVDAFDACDSLTSVTLGSTVPTGLNKIPASVTLIIPAEAYDSYKYFEYFGYKLYDAETGNLLTEIEEDVIAGICGDNAFYVFDKATGTLTISGEGAIDGSAFAPDVNTWVEEIEKVVIGDGITTIGEEAFLYCNALTSVEMNSVTSVGDYAFQNCKSLSTIKMNSVTSIGIEAFSGCSSLTTVEMNSVTSVGDYAFQNCKSLSTIKMNSVTSIGIEAFSGCSSLTTVEMNSVTSIGESAFGACTSLSTIKMNSVETIGANAFYNCYLLTTVEMNSVTSIGDDAFGSCSNLANITAPCRLKGNVSIANAISNGATVTYKHTFAEGSDTCECDEKVERYITDSCGNNAAYVFDKATGKLTISGTGAIKGYAFDHDEFDWVTAIKEVVIGDGITEIGNYAFFGCSSLTSITIPDSVASIGYQAFRGCSKLTSITIPDSVTSIGDWAFSGCSSLSNIEIPNSVTSIGYGAFDQTPWLVNKQNENPLVVINGILIDGIKCSGDVVIPDSVTSIGEYAFFYCSSLTEITIPDSVTSIGVSAFENCSSLTEITIPDSVTSIGDGAFAYCSALSKVSLGENSKLASIGNNAFNECSSLESLKMNSVTSIGNGAFYGCSSLETVEMNSVETIGDGTFNSCSSLTTIKMNSVKSIEDSAFLGCDSLTSVTLGSEVPDGLLYSCIPDTAKLIIPAEAYENYQWYEDFGYNFGFSDIKGIGYILEGQIGIRLATDLSADKLVVMCGEKEITLTQKDGYVEFFVAAQDMAKEYTVYYADGEIEIAKFNPKSNLSGYEDTEYEAVAEALITYCETANAYFNGGEIADMSSEYDDVINAITPNTVDMGEDYDSSSLILESNTIVRHYYTEDAEGRIKKGNYYYVEEAVDPTKFARIDTYSVNDYIYKVLNSDKADANLKNLCVTLYKYGVAAKTLKNGGNK